jgi:hypothetical protein
MTVEEKWSTLYRILFADEEHVPSLCKPLRHLELLSLTIFVRRTIRIELPI